MILDKHQAERALRSRLADLERNLEEVRASTHNLADSAGELSVEDNHPGDAASDLYDRGQLIGQVAFIQDRLSEVKDALHRIEQGTWGICQRCGRSISSERLSVVPQAQFCLDCARDVTELFHRPAEEDVLIGTQQTMISGEQGATGRRVWRQLENWGTAGDLGESE